MEETLNTHEKGNCANRVLANVIAGMILVPKPEHAHRFKDGKEYIVTQKDIDAGNPIIGEYWMVKT